MATVILAWHLFVTDPSPLVPIRQWLPTKLLAEDPRMPVPPPADECNFGDPTFRQRPLQETRHPWVSLPPDTPPKRAVKQG